MLLTLLCISLSSKIKLMRSLVTYIFLYACEEYKPRKWGATARYHASHTKTILPKRKSLPRSNRQSDHTKTSWPSQRDANCSGMVMSTVHQVWPKHLARHSERGKKTRQIEEEVGRQHQGMDRPGVHKVQEGSGEQRKMEETGCEVICGAPTTFAVKG